MTRLNYLSALLLTLLTIGSSQAAEPSSNPSVKFIQRTMRSLAGERNPGEKIRILFYGQSITAQRWRDHVVADLKKRFPEANLDIQNRAIGGFQSPALRRTAEHDLYPFYPDLLIFHVYGDLAIRLNVRELETFPGAWAATRPSKSANWMPAIRHVALGEDPVAETWTVTCLPDSAADGTKIHFRLSGSVTGDDGEGWSTEDFVSNSGRIRIARPDWNIAFPLKLRKTSLPENFQVTWKVYPLFAETFAPGEKAAVTMLVQGTPNGKHTLTITPMD